jgi:hypothetical protein
LASEGTRYALSDTVSAAVLRLATSIKLRRVEQLIGELLDLAGEVAENSRFWRLAVAASSAMIRLMSGNESHVEHPVGLVEDEDLDLAQVDALLLDVIEEPARCRDEDLDAAANDRQLLLDVDAAEDDGRRRFVYLP